VTLQGYTRFTEDIDLLLDADPQNIERLLMTLADFGEGYARELTAYDFDDSEGAIRLIAATELCQINLFPRFVGVPYAEAKKDAEPFCSRRSVDLFRREILLNSVERTFCAGKRSS